MALELADYGIRVNDVSPGMILTPMNQESKDDPKTTSGTRSTDSTQTSRSTRGYREYGFILMFR